MFVEIPDICSSGERPVSRTGYYNRSYFPVRIEFQHLIREPLPHRKTYGVVFGRAIECNSSYRSLLVDQDIIVQLVGS